MSAHAAAQIDVNAVGAWLERAAMAEDGSDQDALIDHAMIERRDCPR